MADESITVTREETAKLLAEIESIRRRMATDVLVEAVSSTEHAETADRGNPDRLK